MAVQITDYANMNISTALQLVHCWLQFCSHCLLQTFPLRLASPRCEDVLPSCLHLLVHLRAGDEGKRIVFLQQYDLQDKYITVTHQQV